MKGRRRVPVPRNGVGTVPAGVSVLPDHVRVDLDSDASEAWRDCADVLYGVGEPAMAARVLADRPGCLLVSVRDRTDGRCTAAARGGAQIETGRVRDGREHARVVSALYGLYARCGQLPALSRCPEPVTVLPAAGHPSD